MSEPQLQLDSSRQQFLNSLLEHPNAPRYNFRCSDLLTRASLQQVRDFEKKVWSQTFWSPDGYPAWLEEFVGRVTRTVPAYREAGPPSRIFEAIPTKDRRLLQQPWSVVPDDQPLHDLTVYTTSGTTGTRLSVPTHPVVPSMLLVLLERALDQVGVRLPRGAGEVAIALVCCQQETLTYASVSHHLEGAGFLKINLAPHQWQKPSDRVAFLDTTRPAVLTGDPYSFSVLAELAPHLRPAALVSSAVTLHEGLQQSLESTFCCPVLDLYSLTEARCLSSAHRAGQRHILLSPDVYVEILGKRDEPLPEGEVGEIVLTGGRNPFFPLLRYKTGDRAALRFQGGQPVLERFQGRAEVPLEDARGRRFCTLDVLHTLREFPLVGFSLRQAADRSVTVDYAGDLEPEQLEAPLGSLFGLSVTAQRKTEWEGKPHEFVSELESSRRSGVGRPSSSIAT